MDPTQPGARTEALAAPRRILARLKLEILGDEDALPGVFTDDDRELLKGDTAERRRADPRVAFATWHAALGTNPDAALDGMRERTYERATGRRGRAARRV